MELSKTLKTTHQNIDQWYQKHGRHHLPWRNTNDPYHIYISEVMLQQTQVKTVLEKYYFPFLNTFPSLKVLANASLETVLKKWEGLGYYNRAKNLHKAAQQTAPSLPNTIEKLQALPGIGKNTAHAIAAFAFKQPVPIMEANAKRILCRVFTLKNPTTEQLWHHAHLLINKQNPFDYNQAIMDIGATLCTRTKPTCSHCPLSHICQGKHQPQLYPTPKQKNTTPKREKNIIILIGKNQQIYTHKRETTFLHGLYGFIETDREHTTITHETLTIDLTKHQTIGHITQTYSHFKLDAKLYLIPTTTTPNWQHGQWESVASLKTLPLSKADCKIMNILEETINETDYSQRHFMHNNAYSL